VEPPTNQSERRLEMIELELDKDKCPKDGDYADIFVCEECPCCEKLYATTVECIYDEL
jgi:hypothetical protein